MEKNYFVSFLKFLLDKEKISQAELLRFLHAKSKLFAKLDNVTVSRWLNGRTSPCVRKQIEIAFLFGKLEHFFKLYKNYSVIGVAKKKGSLARILDNDYRDTFNQCDKKKVIKHIRMPMTSDLLIARVPYYDKIKAEQAVHAIIRNIDPNCYIDIFNIFSINELPSQVGVFDISKNEIVLQSTKDSAFDYPFENIANTLFFTLGYYNSSEDFLTLMGIAINHILAKGSIKDYVVIPIRLDSFYRFMMDFDGKLLFSYKEVNGLCTYYLVQFDFLELISTPFFSELTSKSKYLYDNIHLNSTREICYLSKEDCLEVVL